MKITFRQTGLCRLIILVLTLCMLSDTVPDVRSKSGIIAAKGCIQISSNLGSGTLRYAE